MLFIRTTHIAGKYRPELWPIDTLMANDTRLVLQLLHPDKPLSDIDLLATARAYSREHLELADGPWTIERVWRCLNELYSLSAIDQYTGASAHCDAPGDAA